MVSLIPNRRYGPIGVDLGSRSVKLVQLSADRNRLIESSRWEIPAEGDEPRSDDEWATLLTQAVQQACEGRKFRGHDATVCLGARDLFVQNIRVSKPESGSLDAVINQDAAGRLPFAIGEAEIRYLEAADVRQGDMTKREVILLACHRPVLERTLSIVQRAGLRPVAVDVEPAALLRCYARQFRRDEDRQQRRMFVNVGGGNTAVVISRGDEALFVKYIDVGGRQMDEAVSRHLKIKLADAAALRRHNGDRRADQQDADVTRSVGEALRSVLDQLAHELSLCIRYHSVTFRGQPLAGLVLGGGESTPALLTALDERLNLKCELGDPLRSYEASAISGRRGQWDVATGLALRELE